MPAQVATFQVRMDNKAQSLIVSAVGDEFLDDLDDCQSAREIRETLEMRVLVMVYCKKFCFSENCLKGKRKIQNQCRHTFLEPKI